MLLFTCGISPNFGVRLNPTRFGRGFFAFVEGADAVVTVDR